MDYDALVERATLLAAWRKPGGPTPKEPSPKLYKTLVELIDAIADLRARNEALVKANGILEDALQEVGDDYPGSSCQEWCQQRVKAARAALAANREG